MAFLPRFTAALSRPGCCAAVCLAIALFIVSTGTARADPGACAEQTAAAINANWAVLKSKKVAQLAGANASNAANWYSPGNEKFIAALKAEAKAADDALNALEAAFEATKRAANNVCFDPGTFKPNCGIVNIDKNGPPAGGVTLTVQPYDPIATIQGGQAFPMAWYELPPSGPVTVVPFPCAPPKQVDRPDELLGSPGAITVTPPAPFTFALLLPPTDPMTGKLLPPRFGDPQEYGPTGSGFGAFVADIGHAPSSSGAAGPNTAGTDIGHAPASAPAAPSAGAAPAQPAAAPQQQQVAALPQDFSERTQSSECAAGRAARGFGAAGRAARGFGRVAEQRRCAAAYDAR